MALTLRTFKLWILSSPHKGGGFQTCDMSLKMTRMSRRGVGKKRGGMSFSGVKLQLEVPGFGGWSDLKRRVAVITGSDRRLLEPYYRLL